MRVLPVEDEELKAAKEYSNGNFSVELASQFGLAGRINTVYTFDLDKNFINDFRPKIDALTAADIQRAAAKYFDTYRAAIVIVGDWEKVKDQVIPFGDVTMYDERGQCRNQVKPPTDYTDKSKNLCNLWGQCPTTRPGSTRHLALSLSIRSTTRASYPEQSSPTVIELLVCSEKAGWVKSIARTI